MKLSRHANSPRINEHRAHVCIDLVGRVITIRSAYKGMHQGGNKSGVRARGKYLFSFTWAHCQNGRSSDGWEEGRKPGEKGHVEEEAAEGRATGTENFRAEGSRNPASYLWNGY